MKISILGAGAYGLALANVLNDKNDITVYSVIKKEIDELNETYQNQKLFPNITLPKEIKFTNNIDEAIKDIELIIIAIPTNYIDDTLKLLENKLDKNIQILIASKGINSDTHKFAYDIVKESLNSDNISIISGPSFAIDTIKKEHIILTLAGKNIDKIKSIFPEKYIKVETTTDIVGVELSGTLKNIFAIACGILDGMKTSESTKASFLNKVIIESKNMITSFGGIYETIFSAASIGDIILTCSSNTSRNFSLGILIGETNNKNEIKQYLETTTVEGLDALISIKTILKEKNINNELINLIYDIIFNNTNPKELLNYIIK